MKKYIKILMAIVLIIVVILAFYLIDNNRVDNEILETFANGNELRKNEVYDYYELPSFENGIITVIVSQGSDGNYEGGRTVLEYQSKDMGDSWELASEYVRED